MASGLQPKVFLAGRVAVETDGVVTDDGGFSGRQGRLLFAYLVSAHGRPLPRDELADALWGEALPASWDKALTGIVSKLRSVLADQGIDGASALTGAFGCYRLELPEGTWVDVLAAGTAVDDAEAALAAGELDRAKEAAALAASVLGQPFLPGEDGSWVEGRRRELADLRARALSVLTDASLRSGDGPEAVKWAEQTIALAPFREKGYRQLMEAHVAGGDRAEALRVYERCRRLLAEELGAYPSPETESIYRELLRAAAPEPVATANDETPAPLRRVPRRRTGLAAAAVVAIVGLATIAAVVTRNAPSTAAPVRGDAVAVVDAAHARLIGSVPVTAPPGAIAYGAGSVWVSSPAARSVLRISPKSRQVAESIPLPVAAQSLAVAGSSVWALGSGPNDEFMTLDRIDPTFGTYRRARRLPTVVTGDIGSLSARGSTLLVAPRSGLLTRIAVRSRRTLAQLDPNAAPSAAALGFGSSWLAYREADLVVRVDSSGQIKQIPVGRGPSAIAVGKHAVWVANGLDGTVKSIDPATSAVITTIHVGNAPTAIATDGDSVWVASGGEGKLVRIDERTNRRTATVTIGGSPQSLVVADGKVWASVQTPPAAQPSGGTAVVSTPKWTALDLDPGIASGTGPFQYATCSMLLNHPDEPGPGGLRLVPDAARSFPAVSKDGRSYTFTIRPGMRFSPPSNQPVTAQTFKYAIERTLSPRFYDGESFGQSLLSDVVGARAYMAGKARHITGIQARGDRLTIHVTARAPDLPARLATSPFCAVPTDTPIRPLSGPIPSAGPYYVASVTPGGRGFVLLRNPNYHGDRPHRLQRIEVVVDTPHPVAQIEASKLDYAFGDLPAGQTARLERLYGAHSAAARRGRQRYFVNRTIGVDFLDLNTRRPLFASARMRRAVSYAIDRRALAANGGSFSTAAMPAQMNIAPGEPGFRDRHIYPLVPDLARARRLAGDGHHDAVLYCFLDGGSPRAAQIIKNNLAAIGIDVHIHCGGPMWTLLSRPNEPWDIAIDTGGANYGDPGEFINRFATLDWWNYSHYHDPTLSRRIRAASRLSGVARAQAYAGIDLTLTRDVVPQIQFANPLEQDFFSARIGCQVYQPLLGIDLAALCVRHTQ